MEDVLKKFGRYFLLDQLATGGMAEIYRGRLAAPDGAGRLIVIKRIQQGYGANQEFIKMFRSEIKVTMGFNHPNIVQLYDYGDEQAQPFIVMELVDGRNLRQFLNRFNELKQGFPIELAAHIIEQAACGLHYAHTYRDKITGQALNIVHRDISPQNILISFEGAVKVIDFGIAKASNNVDATRAGVIKGKPSYLSPEQISGEPLDGRCDIFALGIVLWELLTGRKLFSGDNDLHVLKLIESCASHVKPPSTLNKQVPPELDAIVLKALVKDRAKRYQTAEELQRALRKFIFQRSPDFNSSDLAFQGKDLFRAEIVEDRKRVQRLSDRAEELLSVGEFAVPLAIESPEERRTRGIQRGHEPGSGTTDSAEPTSFTSSTVFGGTATAKAPPREIDIATDESVQARKATLTGKPAAAGAAPGAGTRSTAFTAATSVRRPTAPPSQPTQATRSRTVTRAAATRASGEYRSEPPASGGLLKPLALLAAACGAIVFYGPTLGVRLPWLAGDASRDPSSAAHAGKPPASGQTTVLRLNLIPFGGDPQITVNGRRVDSARPVIEVPLDSPLELKAERGGFRPIVREFSISASEAQGKPEVVMPVNFEPVKFGYLTIHTTPSAVATILVDGKPWKKGTPFEGQQLPVGTYNIKLENDVLGTASQLTVRIEEGQVVKLSPKLEYPRNPAGAGE